MAMDAALLDERLTPAKVDVTFSRVCGSSPHMLLTQFRDAMVRLAAIKYPSLPRTEAVMQLYQKHLATFQGTTKGVVAELDQAMLSLLGAARRRALPVSVWDAMQGLSMDQWTTYKPIWPPGPPRKCQKELEDLEVCRHCQTGLLHAAMAAIDAQRTGLKFVDPEAFVEQELWWDLAKTFVAPIPSTVAELEPIKQRMRTDRSYALSILQDVAKCSYSWQMTQYLSQESFLVCHRMFLCDRTAAAWLSTETVMGVAVDFILVQEVARTPERAKGSRLEVPEIRFTAAGDAVSLCMNQAEPAKPSVRNDASVCHEAVSRNVAALEFIAGRFRQDGRILSMWLSIALQKANQKLETRNEPLGDILAESIRSCGGFFIFLDGLASDYNVRAQETENANMDRVVPIAALCVQCGSRCILVSMGFYVPASRTAFAEIKYPGVKVKHGESPYDAAARLCKSRLTPLSDFIQVEATSFEAKEEEDISKRTGLPSRYLRSIFRGHMSPLVPWGDHMQFIPSRSSSTMRLTSKQSSLARRFLRAHPLSPALCPDLFALKQDLESPEITLYAWMPAWEFEYLRYTAQGEALVDYWVQHGDYSVLHTDGSAQRCFTPVACLLGSPCVSDHQNPRTRA
ncbi:unnamed protein product [Symbiodinium sp. CCMP2456]|nr:unnamed protein product [Symbiodinium sp. CCMP2456]